MRQNPTTEADSLIDQELGYAAQDASVDGAQDPFAVPEDGPQLASLFGTGVKGFAKLVKPSTQGIIEGHKKRGASADGPTREQLDQMARQLEAEERARKGETPIDPNDVDGPSLRLTEEGIPEGDAVPDSPRGLTVEPVDTDQLVRDYATAPDATEKRTNQRNVNIERFHEGGAANPRLADMPPDVAMERMETAKDIGRLLDTIGKQQQLGRGVRTHAEVAEAAGDMTVIRGELEDVFSGAQTGLMSDTQLFAARTMLATLGEDTTKLMNRIADGHHDSETLMQYQRKGEALVALQRFLQGQITEVARALGQQRMIAETMRRGSLEDMTSLLVDVGGSRDEIVRHAIVAKARRERALKTGKSELEAMKQTWDSRRRMGVGLAVEYWKANILSGIPTHIVNMTGNTLVNIWENAAIRPIAGTVGAIRAGAAKLAGQQAQDRVYLGESMASFYSGVAGLRDGLKAFTAMLVRQDSMFTGGQKADKTGAMEKAGDAVERFGPTAGKLGRGTAQVLSLPFRLLQAEDDLFKTLAFRQELTVLATRDAYRQGLTGDAALDQVVKTLNDPPDVMYESAMSYAKQLTFTEEKLGGIMGVFADSARKITAAIPELKFIFPFITTPTNLIRYSMETSALAVASPRLWRMVLAGGAQADVAVAKMTAGLGFTFLMYKAYQEGLITGAGPDNFDQQRLREKTGWLPNAIRAGDKYIQYKRTDPFAASIAGLVDTLDRAKYSGKEEDFQTLLVGGAFRVAEHMLDSTFMRGANDMLDLIYGQKDVNKFLANYASGFIPMSSAVRTAGKFVDPQPRRKSDDKEFQTGFAYTLDQQIRAMMPGLAVEMRPARHWDGSLAAPDAGQVAYALVPFKYQEVKPRNRVEEEMIRQGIGISEPSAIVSLGRGDSAIHYSLLDIDGGRGLAYDKYIQRVGTERKAAVTKLMKSSAYDKLTEGPHGERYRKINSMLEKAKRKAYKEYVKKDLPRFINANPEAVSSIARLLLISPATFLRMVKQGVLGEEQMTHIKAGTGFEETPLPLPPHLEEQPALPTGRMPRM
jgi:hypothetical protein